MDTTPRKRIKIVTLNEHTSLTQREIACQCAIGVATVNRIIRQHSETGSVSPQRSGKCGRKRKTTKRDDAVLLRLSKLNPRKTSDMLRKDLEMTGVHLDSSTVRRRLLEGGRKARKPMKKQLLTTSMKKKRLFWASTYKGWSVEQWRKVVFSDESHFEVQGQRCQFVRRADGESITPKHILQTVKHPEKKMFWGCFTYSGPGPLCPVTGMMNSSSYIQILGSKLVPELHKQFPDGTGVFQQDLAPCHTSKLVQRFFKKERITCLQWPGNSPDINPIENLWAICKARLRKLDCSTKEKMICSVIQVWFHDAEIKLMCQKLIDSMPKRVSALLKAKGGHIKY